MRSPRATFAAWLYTGPVGHLYAGLADWAELLARYQWARLRERGLSARARRRRAPTS